MHLFFAFAYISAAFPEASRIERDSLEKINVNPTRQATAKIRRNDAKSSSNFWVTVWHSHLRVYGCSPRHLGNDEAFL